MRQLTQTIFGLLLTCSLFLSAENLPIEVYNFLRLEYDDNIFTTGDGSAAEVQESLVIVEQIEFLLDTQLNNSYFGIRYSPVFKYYEDRPDDDTDLSHQWDFIYNQDFTPRTSFQLKHILRIAEEAELVQDDVSFRNNNDYMYNSVVGKFITQVVPDKTSLQFSGRYEDFAYDDNAVAEVSDYDNATGGFDVVQNLQPETSLSGQFRYSEIDYETDLRDAETIQAGLALSKMVNPKFQFEVRAGYESHEASDEISQDTDTPYGDLNLSYFPAKGTRMSGTISYKQDKSPVSTFTMQERFIFAGTYSNDLTAGITMNLTGSYSIGEFSTDNATALYDPAVNSDGDEKRISFMASLDYNINVRNSMILSYSYTDLESDVRPASDYDRNRFSLGWKYNL